MERFFGAAAGVQGGEKSLPPEIREGDRPCCRETRVNELRQQYQKGTYHISAAEISAAIIEKHLKR